MWNMLGFYKKETGPHTHTASREIPKEDTGSMSVFITSPPISAVRLLTFGSQHNQTELL